MTVPSSPRPSRFTSGISFDYPYQPLAGCGVPNAAFYHVFFDDFDKGLTLWTATHASSGTSALTAGDGGLVLLTTAATTNDYEVLQGPIAGFTLPQAAGVPTGKKMFFETRIKMSDIAAPTFDIGLMNATTTPFSAISDGLYFSITASAISLIHSASSTATTIAVTPITGALANATFIDLAWVVDRVGDIMAWAAPSLVGWTPQSGTGSSLPERGPLVRSTAFESSGMSSANLTPMIALQTASNAAKTATVDFILVAKER